jgi:hypothetical protein
MKLFFSLFIDILFAISNTNGQVGKCTLTHRPSQDPLPSLSKCYKYNNEACCLSVHDDYISGFIDSILSPSCIRKYTDFENLMCLGCHPLEYRYLGNETDEFGNITHYIRICKSFAESLWNSSDSENSLESSTHVFDNCGFKVELDTLLDDPRFKDESYLIPSEAFHSFYEFFEYIKIPFYENYKIRIQNETDDNCYNYSFFIKINLVSIISMFIFAYLL